MMTPAPAYADSSYAASAPSAVSPSLPADNGVREEQRSENAWELHPMAVEVHLGIATPVGALGVMVDRSFTRWFSFGCGGGTNLYFRTLTSGFEGSCMLHLRPLNGRERALSFGFGGSVGSFEKTEVTGMGTFGPILGPMTSIREGAGPTSRTWDVAGWLNFDVGYEKRTLEGATFRIYLGLAELLNPGSGRLDEPVDPDASGVVAQSTTLLYFGVAWGRAW